jgi:hypothetical protein
MKVGEILRRVNIYKIDDIRQLRTECCDRCTDARYSTNCNNSCPVDYKIDRIEWQRRRLNAEEPHSYFHDYPKYF